MRSRQQAGLGGPPGPLVRSRLSVLPRLGLAVVAGVAVGLSWQPYNLWPLLLVGIPGFTIAVRGSRLRRAFGLGYVFGLAMLTLAISWIHVLGVPVAVALILFESLFFGVLGVAISLVGKLRFWPLAAACAWVAVEFAYARIPFGGFGWTRIGYAAVDTPLAGFFPILGVVGVSFLVALTGQLIAWVLVRVDTRRVVPGGSRAVVQAAGLMLVLVLAGAGLRSFEVEPLTSTQGTVNVGIVQGNVPGRGIEALGRARSVTNNHLSETVNLTSKWRLGMVAEPDFILWPENSTDIDPLRDSQTHQVVQSAAKVSGKPILVGAVMEGPGADERQTSALWWDPVRGVLARYDKRNLVPFGEWIPFRAQLLPLLPILKQTGAQSIPGTKPGVLDVPVGQRTLKVGDIICFELAYDRSVYETVSNGAQVLMVQSNNATYGGTGQIRQQFAITRARAMETRREIAVATTNSVSGFIDRGGRVVAQTDEFTAASMVVNMPVRTGVTPAVVLAPWLGRGLTALALLFCVAAALRRWRDWRRPPLVGQDEATLDRLATEPVAVGSQPQQPERNRP